MTRQRGECRGYSTMLPSTPTTQGLLWKAAEGNEAEGKWGHNGPGGEARQPSQPALANSLHAPGLMSGEPPMCRICHEAGASGSDGTALPGSLLAPCRCSGSLGAVHRSCLERWLSTSNSSRCELCRHAFTVRRRPCSFRQWLHNGGSARQRRTLLTDVLCFILVSPLAAVSGWLCLRGAAGHLRLGRGRLEAWGLIALTTALFTIYLFWTAVSLRYHLRLFHDWRQSHQRVCLVLQPLSRPTRPNSGLAPILTHTYKETVL
uniref:E3 ubiquitin-protein ligase MARCHF2-like n=1 Tax=Myxine glutinosa TaxID=7769 RepID=UPI00358E5791